MAENVLKYTNYGILKTLTIAENVVPVPDWKLVR